MRFYHSVRLRISFKLFSFYHFLVKFIFSPFEHSPFLNTPLYSPSTYYSLGHDASSNISSDVRLCESKSGFFIDSPWLDELALVTQVVVKPSRLCYSHGRILYSTLRAYLSALDKSDCGPVTIFETGTARGFSALCMAKALDDSGICGIINTCDILPHNKIILWNTISDHIAGPLSRNSLLKPWHYLLKYIIFFQSTSYDFLSRTSASRIHFAFLDGSHSFKSVMSEFLLIYPSQLPGDIIIFDDYDSNLFPGLVNTVDHISKFYDYSLKHIHTSQSRFLVIATKD